jgi:type I restriction enzyme S subunit
MTGRYQAYSEYKESGIEWLGKMPTHWKASKHKFIATFTKGRNPTSLLDEPKDGTFPYLSMDFLRGKEKPKYAYKESGSYITNNNQPLIIWDGSNAGEFVKGEKGILSSTMAASKLTINIRPEFYWYLCVCLEPEMRKHATGMGIPHVNGQELKDSFFPLPSDIEQQQIASFLDHETAKIDTLITKQEKLIELLKEKRQAVISHAITRGLNPDVSMKDSGVKWLGEVPEHWEICLIKHKCDEITDGAHISPEIKEGEHYFVSIKDIKNGVINFNDALLTSSSSYQYMIKTGCKPNAGDILFSKDGTIGETAITPPETDFVVASSLIIIRPRRDKVIPQFLDFVLQSSLVKEQVEGFVKGAALRRLSIQNLLKVFGTFPPKKEQAEIAEFVSIQLDKYKLLGANSLKQVEFLKERKTALISSAVTGKIDVRDYEVVTNG